jgi:diguanylate cyclase (GGDEF)-like protein/PAS domain S-box-containing protein
VDRFWVAAIGLTASAIGLIAWVFPWQRWDASASLWLVPVAFALIAAHNYVGGADPYRYGLFFMVAYTWLGFGHAPGTPTRFAPLLTAAYVAPFLARGQFSLTAVSSVFYAVPVCLLVGETLAWVSLRLQRAQVAVQTREARFRSLVQNASDVITVISEQRVILYESAAVRRTLGYTPHERLGRRFTEYIHADDLDRLEAYMATALRSSGEAFGFELRVHHRNGSWRWMDVQVMNLLHDPTVAGVILNYHDVTERKALELQLRHQAFYDSLTGLANRALFLNRLEHALSQRHGRSRLLAVLMIDLDDFKTVNDSLGHAAGDCLLREFAGRLQASVRTADTVARLGGDEFAILTDELADVSDAARVAERILESLRSPFALQERQIVITASIGIAPTASGLETVDVLVRNADVAMYRAKREGKGRYAAFEAEMHREVLRRLESEFDLRRAVQAHEFVLHYQPIRSLTTGRIAGVEALVRWQHPERGLLLPDEFLSLAEETGLILSLGEWVMHEACHQAAIWHEDFGLGPSFFLAVNLAGAQLHQPDLIETVSAVRAEAGLGYGQLVFEITETTVMTNDAEAALRKLHALRQSGIRLALDDFGTGYSSLSRLQILPLDILKIDRSFVRRLDDGEAGRSVVHAIIALGSALHLQVLAEGIERPGQADELRELGCELGQGYYLGKPMPADEMGRLLAGPQAEGRWRERRTPRHSGDVRGTAEDLSRRPD